MDKAHSIPLNDLTGLSSEEVEQLRQSGGPNVSVVGESTILQTLRSMVFQPMFILLLACCFLYFILGEFAEAFIMLAALFFVAGIGIFQDFRSQRALKALGKLTKTKSKVIRGGKLSEIHSEEIVCRDLIICEEGTVVPADAEIISSNDFSVNEAILTGESVSIQKIQGQQLLQGTLVISGYCHAVVTAVGKQTVLSGISELVKITGITKTPFQILISRFVRMMVAAGSIAFLFVWAYRYWETGSILYGLLYGLTMAMSVLPEEIPVAFTTFMALGAYRLLKTGVIARNPLTVETLGSATVICLDKTGTLTRNLMQLKYIFEFSTGEEIDFEKYGKALTTLEYAMWSSEISPFDPMEKSIHNKYSENFTSDERSRFKMVKEYPLSGSPPVMTHIFEDNTGRTIIACKGGLETIMDLCHLSGPERDRIHERGQAYAREGYRVLGVAKGSWNGEDWPITQEELNFKFLGIVTFNDPPDERIPMVIKEFYNAGVEVVMITGDYPETALSIARQVGIKTHRICTGKEIEEFTEQRLRHEVTATRVFARVSPLVKLKIIDALKKNGEIVAMTGDGVNDAPALRAAHIGVSMGKRGTEVAKAAAGLILSGDDLSQMVKAIFLGRRINENLRKAIRYIISIHVPVIMLVVMPIFLEWLPDILFSPIHIIFFELIMGPTCSIVYENEPTPEMELNKPYEMNQTSLFTGKEMLLTLIQGLVITVGCLLAGYIAFVKGMEETRERSFIFTTLVFSNIFLTLVNRSFKYSILATIRRKNKLVPLLIGISIFLLLIINYLPFLNKVFNISPLTGVEMILILLIAFSSTFWIELLKLRKPIIR